MLAHIRVEVLSQLYNPLENPPWDDFPRITIEEIAEAIRTEAYKTARMSWHQRNRDRLVEECSDPDYDSARWHAENRAYHIARIAFLVTYGWSDPITVDIGLPDLDPGFPLDAVEDGNHRLSAAIYRGDYTILADVAGDPEAIPDLIYSYVDQVASG
jgi:hypothetical protein